MEPTLEDESGPEAGYQLKSCTGVAAKFTGKAVLPEEKGGHTT